MNEGSDLRHRDLDDGLLSPHQVCRAAHCGADGFSELVHVLATRLWGGAEGALRCVQQFALKSCGNAVADEFDIGSELCLGVDHHRDEDDADMGELAALLGRAILGGNDEAAVDMKSPAGCLVDVRQRAGGEPGDGAVLRDQHVADAAQHQGGERVIHQRLVVNGHQLLADRQGEGVEPGA